MQHLDEGTIHAWLDDALSADEAARVERHAADCAACAALVAEARGLVAGASRILSALDDVSLVVPAPADSPFVTPHEREKRASVGGASRRADASAGLSASTSIPTVARSRSLLRDDTGRFATRRWFRPATLAAAASVVLMVGSVVVLTNSGGREAVATRSIIDSAMPAASPTTEAHVPVVAPDRAEGGVVREGARGAGSAGAATSLRAAAPPAAPRPVPPPQVGAASRDGRRQANESRQSAPLSGGVAGQRARGFAYLDSVTTTAARKTGQEAAPARMEPSANAKAASGAAVPLAPPAPAPAADVAVEQRAAAPDRSAARRAAAAPARAEQLVAAAAAEAQPTVRVDTVFIPGRVDTVTVDAPASPIGRLRPGPARTPPVYPVTGCYVVVEGGVADTLTLTRTPAWSGVAESRWRATAPGATGYWSQPPNGDVHIEIRGALVTARIDPPTGDLRGQVQRGGASERFLARRCR